MTYKSYRPNCAIFSAAETTLSGSKTAVSALRKGYFRIAIWAFSHRDMAYIAVRKGPFRKTGGCFSQNRGAKTGFRFLFQPETKC